MTEQDVRNAVGSSVSIVKEVVRIAKVAVIVAVVTTSVVGGYVLANAELRNQTIDFAQNQRVEVAGESFPKE